MKIAIVGAGLAGLSCALEFERHGVICHIYERDGSVGWVWPSSSFWPRIFTNDLGEIVHYLNEKFDISINYLGKARNIVLKSPNCEVRASGSNLGYFFERGKLSKSIENQIYRKLHYSPVFFNTKADYIKLAKEYDYVIIASGKTDEAKDLEVWQEYDKCYIYGGIAIGSFDNESSTIYFNTEYAGTGYARVTPLTSSQAVVGIYVIGLGDVELETDSLFERFLSMENLVSLDFIYKLRPNIFEMGRVSNVKKGNIHLTGRAAGLTDRLIGVGGYYAIISGILAARSIVNGQDYEEMIKPLIEGVENISAFRSIISKYTNDDFDKLLKILGLPGIKQIIYNTDLNFTNIAGRILKHLNS
ncbi:MAG: NAD(P)-binding protein [Bacillota bacterium]